MSIIEPTNRLPYASRLAAKGILCLGNVHMMKSARSNSANDVNGAANKVCVPRLAGGRSRASSVVNQRMVTIWKITWQIHKEVNNDKTGAGWRKESGSCWAKDDFQYKLSYRREIARRFVSLNILLNHSRSLKVIRNDTVEKGVCKSLLVFHWNYVCMSYLLWDIQRQRMAWPWNWG